MKSHCGPVFLDMTEDVVILEDRGATLCNYLDGLKARLRTLDSQHIKEAGGYYWLLKPDLKPGEGFTF